MQPFLQTAVLQASKRPEVSVALDELYASVQHEIDRRNPVCAISGRCCRFEEYGHRLYVSTLELAHFVRGLKSQRQHPEWDGKGCPFQRLKLCTVHPIRPFGCRMFFCDPTSTDWQNAAYEQFHSQIKRLHEQLEVPYFYVEWRQAINELQL
jgi:Fe-S-cluster containining protein